jgi:hypothetical protein
MLILRRVRCRCFWRHTGLANVNSHRKLGARLPRRSPSVLSFKFLDPFGRICTFAPGVGLFCAIEAYFSSSTHLEGGQRLNATLRFLTVAPSASVPVPSSILAPCSCSRLCLRHGRKPRSGPVSWREGAGLAVPARLGWPIDRHRRNVTWPRAEGAHRQGAIGVVRAAQ